MRASTITLVTLAGMLYAASAAVASPALAVNRPVNAAMPLPGAGKAPCPSTSPPPYTPEALPPYTPPNAQSGLPPYTPPHTQPGQPPHKSPQTDTGLPPYRPPFKPSLGPLPPSSITLVHTNDIHAHMDQFNKFGNDCTEKDIAANTCYGGAARQRTVIDMLRKRNPGNTLLFDAGDQFQGTAFYSYYKGNVTAEVMNDFKYDLMTIGNHEFDDGPEHLAKFFRKLQFPVVCANADFSREESLRPIVKPYHYFPKHDLAVIGYITNTTKFISSPGPNIEFYDPAPPVQKVIDEIKAKGIKRIFAVSHNGYREDMDLAARTRGLDLIVGGHSHTYLSMDPNEPGSGGLYPTKVTNLDGRTTYVVQAKAWGEYVGHLDINFGSDGHISSLNGAPIHLDQSVPEEPNTKAKVLKWREVLDAFGKVVLGEATASFDQASCQHKECDMGNLVADAMLYARRSRPEVRAVILNAGGARAGIDAGPVRVENVNTILPFLNTLVDFDYSGKQLRQLFEDILAKKNRESGKPITSFVQVSGIKAKFDLSRPAYDRVTELLIRKAGPITTKSPSADAFEPVQPDTVYALSSVEYLLRGGDGFFATPPKETPLGTLAEALSDYIRAASPISPRNEGRLQSANNALVPRSLKAQVNCHLYSDC